MAGGGGIMGAMDVGALLLTGGRSRRMGRDKATLVVAGAPLACSVAAALAGAELAGPVLEVGPGVSGLPSVTDEVPGAGPLAAVATGAGALRRHGWAGGALLVATDLPRLDTPMVRWLAEHPFPGCVVPVAGGRPQWLCGRYTGAALDAVARRARPGAAVRDLVAGQPVHLAPEAEWASVSPAGPAVLADVDEPADLTRLGLVSS